MATKKISELDAKTSLAGTEELLINDGGTSKKTTAANLVASSLDGAVVINESGADVDFRIESDTNANAFFLDAGNSRVGIGTSSPSSLLHLSSNGSTITIQDTNGSGGTHNIRSTGSNGQSLQIDGASDIYLNGNNLIFRSASESEYARITSSGRVGIGTSSPSVPLHVNGSNGELLRLSVTSDAGTQQTFGLGFATGATNTHPAALISAEEFDASDSRASLLFYTRGTNSDVAATERMRIDSSGNVGIGTSSPDAKLHVQSSVFSPLTNERTTSGYVSLDLYNSFDDTLQRISDVNGSLVFQQGKTSPTERMRIDSSGGLAMVKTDPNSLSAAGFSVDVQSGGLNGVGIVKNNATWGTALWVNRLSSDGTLIEFAQASISEGSISVSGSTVSYNGGHLSRWSQLPDDSKDETIVKGTVMTNLDVMCEWSHPDGYWTEDDELPVDEDGNPTAAVGDLKKAAYTEDNEQLNRMAVSSVEGDTNVAGVFVNWDNDDDQFNDMNIAMTGDMVIRIAQGVTVNRGDLLMSAGDGTAKPQEDDIVRSKTIAKVTSTHVSHTYDDGSYLVPCVLMAC